MNITEIRESGSKQYDLSLFEAIQSESIIETESVKNEYTTKDSTSRQKKILLDALDKLENNLHLDDSNPLDKLKNTPIESYEEALIELSFIKSPFFKIHASQAQANVNTNDVMYLFVDEENLFDIR